MFRFPPLSPDDVSDAAGALGMVLNASELELLAAGATTFLDSLQLVDDMALEQDKPPVKYQRSALARRPSPQEDPLNAFIHVCRIEGAGDGPLAGKTVGLKDHIAVAGIPLTLGCRAFEGYVPDYDATLVTRLLDAGATVTGKLNMEPFSLVGAGFGGVSDYGRVLNPRQHSRLTGGSSSGSAAAAAAGEVDIAIGGDQGGSIRIPSAWCGIVGLKPTFGLVPHTGVVGLEPTFDHVGPMARTVADVAVALECLAGPDGYDPRQRDLPQERTRYSQFLGAGVAGLRVGVLQEGFGPESPLDEVVRAAVRRLAEAGATVVPVSIPEHRSGGLVAVAAFMPGAGRMFYATNLGGSFEKAFYPADLIAYVGRLRQGGLWELPPFLKLLLIVGTVADRRYHGALYAKANNARRSVTQRYDQAFEGVDVLVMPTLPNVAPPYEPPRDHRDAYARTLLPEPEDRGPEAPGPTPNTTVFNFTGHPAVSVPCGRVDDMPVGLQIVGPYFAEARLLQAAAAIEDRSRI